MLLCHAYNGDPNECKGYLLPTDIYSYSIVLWELFRNPFLFCAIEKLSSNSNSSAKGGVGGTSDFSQNEFQLELINKADTIDLIPKKRVLKKINSISNISAVSEFYNSVTPENIKLFYEKFSNPLLVTDHFKALDLLKVIILHNLIINISVHYV